MPTPTEQHAIMFRKSCFIDSAATYHIGNNKARFVNLRPFSGNLSGIAGIISILGVGDMVLEYIINKGTIKLRISDVRYAPEYPATLLALRPIF